MRVLLELIRIVLIFGFLGGISSTVLREIYKSMGVTQFEWIGFLAILILLFVAYRNRWQFKGWYKGKGKEMLPRKITKLLISFSVLLLISPPIVDYFLQ